MMGESIHPSSMRSPSRPAAPARPTQADIDKILSSFLNAGREMKAWEEIKKQAAAQLSALHDLGMIQTKNEHDGYTISLQNGRRTIELDTVGKAQVDLLKAQMVEEGHAEEKIGAPFWQAREKKG